MVLTNDLLSQFAKITNDNEEQSTENTVYGTIVESDGTKYVRLDGSNIDTPISTTTDASHGDRVTVMIKNHSAVVTGNITSPSAKKQSVDDLGERTNELSDQVTSFGQVVAKSVTTDQLNAESARIEQLIVTGDAQIRGELQAVDAKIENLDVGNLKTEVLEAVDAKIENLDADYVKMEVLEGNYATLENLEATDATVRNLSGDFADFKDLAAGKFEANEADIKNLQTDKLSAADADIKYATITQLDATNANVGNLEAGVAEIDTLIFGSATGTTIHTSFANAVIAQLGNAQIKSAMIDDISANKIKSGTISTGNVQIQSDDGNLVISDETIQISDANRVRVQIGKDSSNDYSINIWDENGELMFSKGGITDAAIKDAIIRNDMVAEDANISANKLDISSLFTEINDSTETIKSSKIYMDADKQTLDVVFTQMSSDVDDLSANVSSQGSAIEVIQGQISSKVWQQDIDVAKDEMSTQYSTLEQTVGGVTARVETVESNAIVSSVEEFYLSTSYAALIGGSWSSSQPTWSKGKYVWRRTLVTYGNGESEYTPSENGVCISGNPGATGDDGKMLYATCDSESDEQEKYAILASGMMSLQVGSTVAVKFTHPNTTTWPTLNVDDSGAKYIALNGERLVSEEDYWEADSVVTFVFDGDWWNISDSSALSKVSQLTNDIAFSYSTKAELSVIDGAIRQMVSETYTTKDDLEEYKETVTSRLDTLPGEITASFTTSIEGVQGRNENLQTQLDELSKYIRLSSDGITIGSNDSSIVLKIDNAKGIEFYKKGEETPFGTWDGNFFHTGNIVIETDQRAQFGNFAFVPRSNGSLSFLKVGG